jgi:Bacterial dipeptidyl-peptidase Sh3 domain
VIASHYAAPVPRRVNRSTTLYDGPSEVSAAIRMLEPGEPFELLDDSAGWAWGYAGVERRVGYVPAGDLAGQETTDRSQIN